MYICKLVTVLLFLSCGSRDNIVDKSELVGRDYRLFQETVVWNLAKAVQDNNTEKIKRLIKEDSLNIDFQEGKFGNTLLMLAVVNEDFESCRTLLDLGADPNKHDTYDGASAIIDAASVTGFKYLQLMLLYGGNPNDIETGPRRKGNLSRMTPLLKVCGRVEENQLEKIDLLLSAGADINYKNEYNQFALRMAQVGDNYDLVIALIDRGADFNMVFREVDDEKGYLWDELRYQLEYLDSEQYHKKMELVSILEKKKEIGYRALPIPDYAVTQAKKMYPKTWKEYLKVY